MKINKRDYRFFEWESVPRLSNERDLLKQQILKRHNKRKDFYSFLKDEKHLFYRAQFANIFSYRCCYCGVSFKRILNSSDIQIDHIFSKSGGEKDNSFNVNSLENLAPSCNVCNSRKSNIVLSKSFAKKISPYTIASVFERAENLRIIISKPFIKDNEIKNFYDALHLGSEFYRLSYFYEFLINWMTSNRFVIGANNYYDFMIIAIILGETLRSNANYRR